MVMFFRSVLSAVVVLAASVSLAGPVRLGTSFFLPAGLTNPVVLDARVNDNDFLVTATEADVIGGGKRLVITQFKYGSRAWSSTINTPVSVAATGQIAGKFQILPDGASNTYVLSPRAGNPDFPSTTEDLILRQLNYRGTTGSYLSIVRYLAEQTGKELNVSNGRMLLTKRNSTDTVLAVTAVDPEGFSSIYLLYLDGPNVVGLASLPGSYSDDDAAGRLIVSNTLFGLTPSGTPEDPRLRLAVKQEVSFFSYGDSSLNYDRTSLLSHEVSTDADTYSISLGDPTSTVLADRMGFQAEGLGSSEDQELVLSRDASNNGHASRRASSFENVVLARMSSVPYTATRVGGNWLVYGQSMTGAGEFILKYPAFGALTATSFTISDAAAAPYYAGSSFTSSRRRAYLAGGPTVNGFQGIYSSFSDLGELVYSAGVKQPLTLSTSFVVPTTDKRFWTVGTTSTGLQAVIQWQEPEYFVGISARSSARRGDTVTVKAHLNTPAPTGGYRFAVSVSSNLQDAPRTVTVPAGDSTVTFTVKVKNTATVGSATVVARTNATHDINTAHTATFTIQ